MFERFNDISKQIINKAAELASTSGGMIGTEQLLVALTVVPSSAKSMLERIGVGENTARQALDESGEKHSSVSMSARTKSVLDRAQTIAKAKGFQLVQPEHILYSLLAFDGSYAVEFLKQLGVDYNSILAESGIVSGQQDVFSKLFGSIFGSGEDMGFNQNQVTNESAGGAQSKTNAKLPRELDGMGIDLTERAEEGKIDPVIGRTDEIERVIQILSRRTKNNPVLIGEPGVGKSAIVEGLAQAIVEGRVPETLKEKRIFSMDIASMIAGTKYRGDFEEKLKGAMDAVKKAGNIIVFIDEIHMIVGAGATGEGAMDAGNILKPLLARGEMQTIGATTTEEYRKHIEKDSALERRFQPIMVNPPSVEDTVKILSGIKDKYEAHHKVSISESAIRAAAELSDKYISDRFLPDKAIDLIDEASSRKRIGSMSVPESIKGLYAELEKLEKELNDVVIKQDYQSAQQLKEKRDNLKEQISAEEDKYKISKSKEELSISDEDIADIVSKWTGIPITKLTESESERLMNLENVLHERVIGQEEAIKSISRAVRRARAGLKDPKRPIGSFIFLGPTGVGKTEVAKTLAEAMFGDENMMIRLDMSEYMEKFNVSKLIGSAPGYVGYDEGGQLTEKVRRKPYSVILFDEIEKAHPDVFNVLLQILDDGRLTDSHGRVVSFKNTVIIMTSNIGADEINKSKLGFGKKIDGKDNGEDEYERMKERQMESLKRAMRPEFINRVDDIVIFRKLNKEEVGKIAKLMIATTLKRLSENNITASVSEAVENYIVEKGYDEEYGARPLKRAVQRYIEDALSEAIISGKIAVGDNVSIDMVDGEVVVSKSDSKEKSKKPSKSKTDN